MLSVVLPSFNEEANIKNTAERLRATLEGANIAHELIFVDDGSTDKTWALISELAQAADDVRGVSFSRNFGKEACIFAGLRAARGDCTVVMDCDLQHPPEALVDMYALWREGYEVIEGVKRSRGKESLLHKLSAGAFYKLISRFVKMDMEKSSDFKLLDKKVVKSICALSEKSTFFRALSYWVGYKTIKYEYAVAPRAFGESKWSSAKLIKYAVRNITSFTAAPLQIVTGIGFALVVVAAILGAQTLVKYIIGASVEGFTTVILLILLIGGCIMISLGIIGYYLARIFDEIKARPQYLISKTTDE